MSNPYQGKEFCARLSKLTGQEYRLPTEAEWEYTCRAVNSEQSSFISSESEINPIIYPPFHFGETITTDLANYCGKDRREYYKSKGTYTDEPQGEYREETTPLGMFPPNAFGLYDMHGNVLEWCEHDWHDNYNDAATDGSAWMDNSNKSNLVVLRCGSCYFRPDGCRYAVRYNYGRCDVVSNRVSFRLVCDSSVNSHQSSEFFLL